MTFHDVVRCMFENNQQQITAYQADINNLLALLTTLQEQQQELAAWLAVNPS